MIDVDIGRFNGRETAFFIFMLRYGIKYCILHGMKNNSEIHKRITAQITSTPALQDLAELISEKIGSCKRNSIKTGTGHSISHGYNGALLIAAEALGLSDLTKQSDWYKQYKSMG